MAQRFPNTQPPPAPVQQPQRYPAPSGPPLRQYGGPNFPVRIRDFLVVSKHCNKNYANLCS